jgi:hypothetical protein
MRNYRIILSVVLLLVALGVLTPQFAQNAPVGPEKPDQERRFHALGLLRTINTAEVPEIRNNGSYASWPILLAHQTEYLYGWLTGFYPHEVNLRFADMPEILPGYSLRLNVHADGQGYDVRLQDMTDKQGYAAFSDESGIIWQGEPLH